MRNLGIVLLIIGVFAFIAGFQIDTTVYAGFGERVHNIGLMNDRQNLLIFAGVLSVIGAIFLAVASKSNVSGSSPATTKKFDGERNLTATNYQLYLTQTFNIEKNATLEKYIIESSVFDTLADALEAAHQRYDNLLNEKEAETTAIKKRGRYIIAGAVFGIIVAGIYLYSLTV